MCNIFAKERRQFQKGKSYPSVTIKYSHQGCEGIKGEGINKHVIDRDLASTISMGFVKGRSIELLILHLSKIRLKS